jgi:phosphate starvation-inducible membrane PsiE
MVWYLTEAQMRLYFTLLLVKSYQLLRFACVETFNSQRLLFTSNETNSSYMETERQHKLPLLL